MIKPVARPVSTTVYTLKVSDRQGCFDSVTQKVTVNPLGLNNLAAGYSINVFPNPSTGELIIQIQSSGQINKITYLVYNSSGRLMHTQKTREERVSLDLKHLAPGSYTLVMTSEVFTWQTQIILAR